MKQLIDLSVLVENTAGEPLQMRHKRLDHYQGARRFCREVAARHTEEQADGLCRLAPSDFPERAFITLDTVTLPTHMGTHVDAPVHYGPLCEGRPARSIDQLPLEWFYGPGVKLDLRYKKAAEPIWASDIEAALVATGHRLAPMDIVLVWTGTDRLWGRREYFTDAPGMTREATAWLVERGIKLIGIDTYGFDRPFGAMLADFWRTGDRGHLWPAHFYGREHEYVQIERLANLDRLPARGFDVACFPLRIRGLDASWVRAVAFVGTSEEQENARAH